MPPLTARPHYGGHICSGRRRCLTQRGAAFTAEAFARLVCGTTLRAGDDERCATSCTEFAPFSIIAATFGTTHIAPLWLRWVCPVKLCCLLVHTPDTVIIYAPDLSGIDQ